MGITIHNLTSPYTFLMGILWFSAFVLLSLLMRKLKSPVKFSVTPLLVILSLSLFRMFFPVDIGSTLILSDTILPAIVRFLRYEMISQTVFGLQVSVLNALIATWILVTVFLLIRIARIVFRTHKTITACANLRRDEESEAILKNIIGSDECVHVYRLPLINDPMVAGTKPYIFLPLKSEFDVPPEELSVFLLHEWKHYVDKDYYTDIIADVICAVFWWNPLVYVLRSNLSFAIELKCDHYAVSKTGIDNFMNAIYRLGGLLQMIKNKPKNNAMSGLSLVGKRYEAADRIKALQMYEDSPRKRKWANLCVCVVMVALLVSSYAFQIQPAFWTDPNIVESDRFDGWDYEPYRASENFIYDNGDGTFSLYIDGQHVRNLDDNTDDEIFVFLPIRQRGDE